MKRIALIGVMMLVSGSAWAQSTRPATESASEPSADLLQARYQIGVLERVLEQAVQHGAQLISRQMQSITPDLLLFTGPARARGFWLEGYGVFFDLEVPALRRSLTWSFRALDRGGLGVSNALQSLRQHVKSVADVGARDALEQALARIELQVAPVTTTDQSRQSPTPASVEEDPGEAYTREVKRAVINAMLDHSTAIEIGPKEWLTVASRGTSPQLTPADLSDVVTIVLRISGANLEAFQGGRIDKDEARARIELQEF